MSHITFRSPLSDTYINGPSLPHDMDFATPVLLGVGLAMDAFAVSLGKGMAIRKPTLVACATVGLWFGLFQFLMPVVGYAIGAAVYDTVAVYAYIIAFVLLLAIGANMIKETWQGGDEVADADLGARTMLLLAVATSLDALATGISIAMDGAEIWSSAAIIGAVTFAIAFAGMKIGSRFGDALGSKANYVGGAILIAIGIKILLEGAGII